MKAVAKSRVVGRTLVGPLFGPLVEAAAMIPCMGHEPVTDDAECFRLNDLPDLNYRRSGNCSIRKVEASDLPELAGHRSNHLVE